MQALLTLAEKSADCFFAAVPRFKPSSRSAKNARIIAHRGAHDNQQGIFENTHKAFQRARELGCWGIECDVHVTADGVLVVHHDPHLTRLWHQDVFIADLSFNQLKSLAPEIPALEDVVKEYSDSMHLLIELKTSIDQDSLLAALGDCKPIKNYHLLTLTPAIFAPLDQIPQAALLLVAGHNNVNLLCDLSIEKQYGGLLGNYLLLTNKCQQRLVRAQQIFGVGFVNSKNSLYRELNRGVQWLITNEAQTVLDCLQSLTSC